MKAHIVRIGNSRGIRLPKTLLQEAQLEDEVELQAEPGRILISKTAKPRAGWAEAAKTYAGTGRRIASSTHRRQLGLTRKSGSGGRAHRSYSRRCVSGRTRSHPRQ